MARTEVTGLQIKDGTVDLAVDVSGVLPVSKGGSGSSTLALNHVVLGNGSGAVQSVAPGLAGNVLVSDGTTWTSRPDRSVQTVTANATLGAETGTDYVTFSNIAQGKTSSLIHFDGTNGSTTVTDAVSGNNWTRFGGAVSTAQSMFGGASWYGGLVRGNVTAANFAFGTADFSIEMWLRPTAAIADGSAIADMRTTAVQDAPYLYVTGGKLAYHVAGTTVITGSTALAVDTWQHVAVARISGVTRLFLGGAQEGSWADPTNYVFAPPAGTAPSLLARFDNGGVLSTTYFDEFRTCKGLGVPAAYAAPFTPPIAAFTAGSVTPGTITLPNAVGNTSSYTIVNINATDTVNLAAQSGQTVSVTSLTAGSRATVVSDGANWRQVA